MLFSSKDLLSSNRDALVWMQTKTQKLNGRLRPDYDPGVWLVCMPISFNFWAGLCGKIRILA